MRTIDVRPITDWITNELMWARLQKKGAFDSMTGRQAANVIGKRLDDAPTIDAIPVEWLRQEAMKDDGLMNSVIRGLLMKWQKEQEAQDG